jgi:hypothetical protein
LNRVLRPSASLLRLCSIIALTSFGCGTTPAGSSQDSRDSAGVTVVEYHGEDRRLAWTFEERFRLGGADEGPEAFFRLAPSYLAVDSNARITVLDPANFRLVQFDGTGRFRWMTGRQGGGPGEFENPGRVLSGMDGTIAVYDYHKRALLWFDSTGASIGQSPLAKLGLPWGIGFLGDALVVGRRGPWRDDNTRTVSLEILGESDTVVLASVELPPTASQFYKSCAVSISLPPVFAPTLLWHAALAGLVLNAEPAYVVNVIHQDHTRLSIRRDLPPRPASEAAARRELGDPWNLQIGVSRTCPIPAADLIEQRGIAALIPMIRDLALAPDGSVWVRRWILPDDPAETDIFDPAGRYVGTLVGDYPFPVGFLPNGDVLTVEADASDVQRLVVYRVVRS